MSGEKFTIEMAFEVGYDKGADEAIRVALHRLTMVSERLEATTFSEPFKSGLITGVDEAIECLRTMTAPRLEDHDDDRYRIVEPSLPSGMCRECQGSGLAMCDPWCSECRGDTIMQTPDGDVMSCSQAAACRGCSRPSQTA